MESVCGMCGGTGKLTRVREYGKIPMQVCQACLDSCCEDTQVDE